MYCEYTDPETRIAVATHILSAQIASGHADYKVEDTDIAKSVSVADRLLARLKETAPQVDEENAPVPSELATPQPLDLTDEERDALPTIEKDPEQESDASDSANPGPVDPEPADPPTTPEPPQDPATAENAEPAKPSTQRRRQPVDLATGDGL